MIVIAIVVLLVISLRNTWDLLVTVGEVTIGEESQKQREVHRWREKYGFGAA